MSRGRCRFRTLGLGGLLGAYRERLGRGIDADTIRSRKLDALVPSLARSKRPALGPRASHQAALRIVKEPACHPDCTRRSLICQYYFLNTLFVPRRFARRGGRSGVASRSARGRGPDDSNPSSGPGVACQSWLPPGQARRRAIWFFGARRSLPVVVSTGASPAESGGVPLPCESPALHRACLGESHD